MIVEVGKLHFPDYETLQFVINHVNLYNYNYVEMKHKIYKTKEGLLTYLSY